MFKNWFKKKEELKPVEPPFVEEDCYVKRITGSVFEGKLRRLKNGKIIVAWPPGSCANWAEANPDGSIATQNSETVGWFQ